MKIIRFLPFVNDKKAQAWRRDLESTFLQGVAGGKTWEIDKVRYNHENLKNKKFLSKMQQWMEYQAVLQKCSDKIMVSADEAEKKKLEALKARYEQEKFLLEQAIKDAKENDKKYYTTLHGLKAARQSEWMNYLATAVGAQLQQTLENIVVNDDDIIVAALPEFFWVDINDNDKHSSDIVGYHKPLYEDAGLKVLLDMNGPLQQLVDNNKKLILFAGTAMTKQINVDNHEEEKIYNTLLIYRGGESPITWKKQKVSLIDGFYDDIEQIAKEKIGADTSTKVPICEFEKVSFTYDICRDFWDGGGSPASGECFPLSSRLASSNKETADVNVLIAAGMPLAQYVKLNTLSPYVLRCDANDYGNENRQDYESCATVIKWNQATQKYTEQNIPSQTNSPFGVSSSIEIPDRP